jgi:hypothetical protein
VKRARREVDPATSLHEDVADEEEEKGPRWAGREPPWRPGVNGGKPRYGGSGGQHREYYRFFYRAKQHGPAAMASFIEANGPPPSHRG